MVNKAVQIMRIIFVSKSSLIDDRSLHSPPESIALSFIIWDHCLQLPKVKSWPTFSIILIIITTPTVFSVTHVRPKSRHFSEGVDHNRRKLHGEKSIFSLW